MSEMEIGADVARPRFATEKVARAHFGLDKSRWNALRKLNLIPSPVFALLALYLYPTTPLNYFYLD